MPNNDAYEVDLAYIHDTGYGDFARNSAPALLSIVAQCGQASQRIVDLGCGSGIWVRLLAESGYQVTGVDVSAAMIEIARQRLPGGEFHLSSFVDFPIPVCRAVTALGEVFNYLFDANSTWATLRQVFQNVFNALVSGGVFIFDIAEPGRSRDLKQLFREGDDWACLVEFQHDEQSQQLTRRIVTFRRLGEAYRRHEETHRQQLYQRTDVADLLRSFGFQIEIVTGYGDQPFPEGLVGFIARKP
jgi:SAM-dependent methyltransferase